jgi:mycothiol synthase
LELNLESARHDEVAPLSETPLLRLRSGNPALTHLLIRENQPAGAAPGAAPGAVVGYAQIDRAAAQPSAELVVHPAMRRRGIGTQLLRIAEQDARIPSVAGTAGIVLPQLRVWAHGDIPAAKGFAAKHNYEPTRELLQLFRPLKHAAQWPNPWVSTWRTGDTKPSSAIPGTSVISANNPPTQPMPMQSIVSLALAQAAAQAGELAKGGLAESAGESAKGDHNNSETTAPGKPETVETSGFQLRTFRPGIDDEAWIALNSVVFADHPEQGRLTLSDLQDRMEQPWFDPRGFFVLAAADGTLSAYCWTKVPKGVGVDHTIGEIYAIGVDPRYRGKGLGSFLLEAAMSHLTALDLTSVRLYTEADNEIALRNYLRVGFERGSVDVQYAKRK